MGKLSDYNLDRLIGDFGCRVLVETGTGRGEALAFAAKSGFSQIFSIESDHKAALAAALAHVRDHRITVINAKITRGLGEALAEMDPALPALFWLNAPALRKDAPPGRLGLEADLRFLAGARDLSRDIFLLNDVRLYMDGPFEAGPAEAGSLPPAALRSLDFFDEILEASHTITVLPQNTGLLSAFPRR